MFLMKLNLADCRPYIFTSANVASGIETAIYNPYIACSNKQLSLKLKTLQKITNAITIPHSYQMFPVEVFKHNPNCHQLHHQYHHHHQSNGSVSAKLAAVYYANKSDPVQLRSVNCCLKAPSTQSKIASYLHLGV